MKAIRSEAIKAATLASTWLLTAAILALVTPVSIALHRSSPAADLISIEIGTLPFLLIGCCALGAVLLASEFGGRQLPTSLLAVPRRWVLLGAKLVILAGLTVLVVWIWAGVSRLGTGRPWNWFLDRSTWLVLLGALAVSLIAWGVAATTGDLIAALVISLSLVTVAPFLTQTWPQVHRWLPSSLIGELVASPEVNGWQLLALGGWVAAGAIPGAVRLLTRDV